jgi:glutamate 5-kinase
MNPEGLMLGIGKVQYDSEKAREMLGKKNQKPLIHCDYLYLE